MDDALRLRASRIEHYHFSKYQIEELRKLVLCEVKRKGAAYEKP